MALYTIANEAIEIKVDSKGAELRFLTDRKTKREYMWSGDDSYWGRVSPVLFPLVGSYRDGKSRYRGQVYELSQHGFARDMQFELKMKREDEILFSLTDDEITRKNYPFAFTLEIGYRLIDRSVEVMWHVHNAAKETMYFSIGGHPAFNVPKRQPEKITSYIALNQLEHVIVRTIKDGLATEELRTIKLLEGGILPVTEEVFARDALVAENNQTGKVQLLDENKVPYLTVTFDAPLFGIWTPPGKNAPFICIEPWYGRCDKEDFAGNLEDREWCNALPAGETFMASYTISV